MEVLQIMPQSDIERQRYDIEFERNEARQKALRDKFDKIDWGIRTATLKREIEAIRQA